MNKNYTGDLKN